MSHHHQNAAYDYDPKIYMAVVVVLAPRYQEQLLNALSQIPGLRLVYKTTDYGPLRIIRQSPREELP